jgi:Family of unknown function (DUF5954)
MSGAGDNVPAYRTVRVSASDTPVAELADTEAWQAREEYPQLSFGGPGFGVAREREEGGWELLTGTRELAPQDARDNMGAVFRRMARAAGESGDQGGQAECMRAAERMDAEVIDELTVRGSRYRVVRADAFIRSGPSGPERPRPSDPDPGESGRGHELADPAAGFVIDPVIATGMATGMLKLELLESVYPEGSVPPEVRADSERAVRAHPGGVLLPTAYTTAELEDGRWNPTGPGTHTTPQDARDSLAYYLRVFAPWQLDLDQGQRAVYAAAADDLDARRGNEFEVAGRQFRVVRVERLVRIGPDGPEGPRPSDYDPQPPVKVQEQQLRERGVVPDADENAPIELDEDTQRLAGFVRQEEQRRRKRLGRGDAE